MIVTIKYLDNLSQLTILFKHTDINIFRIIFIQIGLKN